MPTPVSGLAIGGNSWITRSPAGGVAGGAPPSDGVLPCPPGAMSAVPVTPAPDTGAGNASLWAWAAPLCASSSRPPQAHSARVISRSVLRAMVAIIGRFSLIEVDDDLA